MIAVAVGASERKCGSCSACCTLQGVKEGLPERKPPCVTCAHVRPQGGCGIYADRPEECKTYRCLWLEGLGFSRDRPDRIRALFEPVGDRSVLVRVASVGVEHHPRVQAIVAFLRARKVDTYLLPYAIGKAMAYLNHPMTHVDKDGIIVGFDPEEGPEEASSKGGR